MVAALWYRPSDWLEGLRLLWGKFEGKGAVARRSPFPVADSKETTPPVRTLNIYASLSTAGGIKRIMSLKLYAKKPQGGQAFLEFSSSITKRMFASLSKPSLSLAYS